MCPAMTWLDCGQRFRCPFCDRLNEGKMDANKPSVLFKLYNFKNPKNFEFNYSLFCSSVPWQHYQPTDGVEGARVDTNKRPELSMGSYEILASQQVRFTQTSLRFMVERVPAGQPWLLNAFSWMWASSLASKLKLTNLLAVLTFCGPLPGWCCCAGSGHRRVHASTERRTLGVFNTKTTSSAGLMGKVRRASCRLPHLLSFSLNSSSRHPLSLPPQPKGGRRRFIPRPCVCDDVRHPGPPVRPQPRAVPPTHAGHHRHGGAAASCEGGASGAPQRLHGRCQQVTDRPV